MHTLRLLKRLWQTLPLSEHNRWRLTTIVLAPVLPFIRGSVVHTAYVREKEWMTKRIRPAHGDPLPVLPTPIKADIIILGVIDWRFRIQRPQHLARGFAAMGHRVFYISTAFVNARRPGFEIERMDESSQLFSVRLHLKNRPGIHAPPSQENIHALKASLTLLMTWIGHHEITNIVQHPYWYEIARTLGKIQLIYDCMDHHEGFGHPDVGITALELALLKKSDAIVTTSQWLRDRAAAHNTNVVLIRNAADYGFFSLRPQEVYHDPQGRRVLGYYGAIADWLDVELLEKVALQFTSCLLLLVGADECGARQRLASLPNVNFTGEVKYAELPYYLYGMDVCLLPFRVTPLTLATNPVKVYEYLAAGKHVVSVELPELTQFGDLVATASTHDDFAGCIAVMLASTDNEQQKARKKFAERNTWQDRVGEFNLLLKRLAETRK